jgi:hypothetical protein
MKRRDRSCETNSESRLECSCLGRFDGQSNELPHRAVVAAAFGNFIAVPSAARICVPFDSIKTVLTVSRARNDTRMGELINDDVPR